MTAKIEINAPISKVFSLFTEKDRFPEWKLGFVNYVPVSGTAGEEGAVTRLNYKKYSMIETILEKRSPGVYTTTYDYLQKGTVMMSHKAVNRFTALDGNKTLVEVESSVTKVNNLFARIMVKLFAKAGEKQFHDQLKLFKTMAEKS